MAFYQLIRTQQLAVSFSPHVYQKEITPEQMGFIITGNNGAEKMYPS